MKPGFLLTTTAALVTLSSAFTPSLLRADCTTAPLSMAAAELLTQQPLSSDALLEAAHRAGSDAPTVHAYAIDDQDDRAIEHWLTELQTRLGAPIECGEARTDARRLILAAPAAGHFEIDRHRITITLAANYSGPILYVEDDQQQIHAFAIESSRRITLPSDIVPTRLQLVANGPEGPRPIAERTLVPIARPAPTHVVDEHDIDDVIAALRRHRHALRPHRILSELANIHAENVCRVGHAAHELTPGADPRQRLSTRGLRARHVGEVIARGESVTNAFDTLLASPSHRSALIDRRFTDAGIGLSRDARDHVCLVILLAAWPRLMP